ncbi:suppressor of fused domain protein [Pedobacter punctiformis]|uniref:Suppressor of fused domain protein n=1 Tax=Pedobacter punctiformis TaxID=3004097 RepID=A0ABT4L6Y4_9SPHI|nr:suppressor of fused domain protein [Pedobacter sp. HCMS5-2]MCZ4243596.1 suppressor of fused domain protein [Pedobacter sp. HCMS5-2]
MKELLEEDIKMAKFIAGAIGFEPQVYPYYDNDRTNQLDILKLTDPVDNNIGIYCTIGVSNYPNIVDGKNIPLELMLTAYKRFEKATNILSTCGFYIIKDRFECGLGGIFKRMIEFYYKGIEMKHIFFIEPFLWSEKLVQMDIENKEANFLLCIPISDKELEFKLEKGSAALEELLMKNQIDIYDLDRKCVIENPCQKK